MFTIRHNVFETNSSSEHALKVNRDVPRTKEDFPLPNDQGILEIEATRYWESGVSVSSIRDIMEYICLLCYSVEDNFDSAFAHIKKAYEEIGLQAPNGLSVYVIDHNGKRHSYTDDDYINGPYIEYRNNSLLKLPNGDVKPNFIYRWYLEPVENAGSDNEEVGRKMYEFTDLDAFIGTHAEIILSPLYKMLCECDILNVNVGIACQCLAFSPTLDECLSDLVDNEVDYNWQNIDDAFRFESTLYFYHS